MIVRLVLLLLVGAFSAFAAADVLLEAALPYLPDFMTAMGIGLLLSALTLLCLAGLWLVAVQIMQATQRYFSASQRGQRRLLFIAVKQAQLKQLFQNRALRIHYVHALKRRRLLTCNQRKHTAALAKTIQQDLHALKAQLPKTTFQHYQQQLHQYQKQQDSAALLQLQQEIHHAR